MGTKDRDARRRSNTVLTEAREWPLLVTISATVAFLLFGGTWLSDLTRPLKFASLFLALFSIILLAAFSVVRHAESLAIKLGEPLGTLVLTLSVTGIEVSIIAASMFTGKGYPTLARDTMFAVVMIVLNGMVGLSLLLGGWRYHEQSYNLQGANAFLAVIIPPRGPGTDPPELHHFITWTDVLHSASHILHRHDGRSLRCIFGDSRLRAIGRTFCGRSRNRKRAFR